MKNLKIAILTAGLTTLLFSCTKQSPNKISTEPPITFEQLQTKFGMKNSFSAYAKQKILQKHGTTNAFLNHVTQRLEFLKKQKKQRTGPTCYNVMFYNADYINGVHYFLPSNDFLMSAAQDAGFNFLSTCESTGSSSSCVASLIAGSVDQSLQSFLDDDQVDAGYILPCVSMLLSDCEILLDQEQMLN
jgi:ferredoxin